MFLMKQCTSISYLDHAEHVPPSDLKKPYDQCYYVPIHMVSKESSTTTKYRPGLDASAKSSTGISFYDHLSSFEHFNYPVQSPQCSIYGRYLEDVSGYTSQPSRLRLASFSPEEGGRPN